MFHPQKFLMTSFLSLILNFEFPPPFSLKHYIFPSFGKFIISPYFEKFPPGFVKCTCFFCIFYAFFVSPTFTTMHLFITHCTYRTPCSPLRCQSFTTRKGGRPTAILSGAHLHTHTYTYTHSHGQDSPSPRTKQIKTISKGQGTGNGSNVSLSDIQAPGKVVYSVWLQPRHTCSHITTEGHTN